ncbi:MAG: DUF1631 family protein, partial [Gammaproteobacteria bacterium]|nr:DUF1631 family protein [Gammaproteobacteria bacterium]
SDLFEALMQCSSEPTEAAADAAEKEIRFRPEENRPAANFSRYSGRRLNPFARPELSHLVTNGQANVPQIEKLIADIRQVARKALPELIGELFDHLETHLVERFKASSSERVIADIHQSLNLLKTRQSEVSQIFSKEVLSRIDNPRQLAGLLAEYRRQSVHIDHLHYHHAPGPLATSGEFQEWLSLASMIDQSYRQYENVLGEMQARLGMMVASWGYNEGNPLGVYVICHALNHAAAYLDFPDEARAILYQAIQERVLPNLRKTYAKTLHLLEQCHFFPDMDETDLTPASLQTRIEFEKESLQSETEVEISPVEVADGPGVRLLLDELEEVYGIRKQTRVVMEHLVERWERLCGTGQLGLHPVLDEKLLNVLDQLITLDTGNGREHDERVSQILSSELKNNEDDWALFARIFSRLSPLVENELRQFVFHFQRTVRASEEQESILVAQYALVQEMERTYAGCALPDLFVDLLVPYWRNLLLNTYLRHGRMSKEWRRHWRILNQVYSHLNGDHDPALASGYMTPVEVISQVQEGLDSIACNAVVKAPLLKALHQCVTFVGANRSLLKNLHRSEARAGEMASLLGFEDAWQLAETRKKIVADSPITYTGRQWHQYVLEMMPGDRLEDRREVLPGRLILSWSNEDRSRMVFVDDAGIKAAEFSVTELVESLAREEIHPSLTLMEGQSFNALSGLISQHYRQLQQSAVTEASTGLPGNRVARRLIQKAILDAHSGSPMLLSLICLRQAMMDEAREADLKEIVSLMDGVQEGLNASLFIYDDQSIALLMPDENRELLLSKIAEVPELVLSGTVIDDSVFCADALKAQVVAARQRLTERLRSGDEMPLTSAEILPGAAYISQPSVGAGSRISESLSSVEDFSRFIEAGQLSLHCQKMIPLGMDGQNVPFYEVLLEVRDAQGQPMDAGNFILAAEIHGATEIIDQWVVKNTFRWIADNRSAFDPDVLFTINLSRSSLNNADFTNFVLKELGESRVAPGLIGFEIREGSLINASEELIAFMQAASTLGIRFMVDDMGHSEEVFAWMERLPVYCIKVDGDYVRQLTMDSADWQLLCQINLLCHQQQINTLAMHVENEAVLSLLISAGFDYAQGFGQGGKVPLDSLLSHSR